MPTLPLVLSSDSHVFEPPDLWQSRIDAAFRDRAPRIERIHGGDHIVVEADQVLSGIGLISNAGARFEAPETIFAQGRFEDVHRGGYDPEQHLEAHGKPVAFYSDKHGVFRVNSTGAVQGDGMTQFDSIFARRRRGCLP